MSFKNTSVIKMILKVLMALLLLALLLAMLLPWITEKTLQKVLIDQGLQSVEIAKLDLDLWAGEIRLTDGVLQAQGQPPLQFSEVLLRISWSALWHKRLLIEQLTLKQLQLTVHLNESGNIRVLGLPAPQQTNPIADSKSNSLLEGWQVGLQQFNLQNMSLTMETPQQSWPLVVDSLQVSNVLSWQPSQQAQFAMQLRYQQTQWQLDGQGQPFADARSFKGQLQLADLDLALGAALVPKPLSRLAGQGHLKLDWSVKQQPDNIELDWNGRASVTDLQLQKDDLSFANQRISWTGQGYLDFNVAHSQLSDLAIAGQLEGHQLQLTSSRVQQPLLSLEHFVFGVDLPGLNQLRVSELALTQLQLNAVTDQMVPLWVAKSIKVDQVQLSESSHHDIGTLLGQHWQIAIHMNAQQQPQQWLAWLDAVNPRTTALNDEAVDESESQPISPQQTAVKDAPFRLKINAFELQDSVVDLEFVQYQPSLQKQLQIKSFTFGPIDTQQPNAASTVDLQASVDQYSKVLVTGTLSPLPEKIQTNLQVTLKGVDLHSFSPIIEPVLAHRIQSGSLSSVSEIQLAQDQLTSEHQLTLKGLSLSALDSSITGLSSIKLGLNLLRDDQDQIVLKIPINGNMSSPNFELKSVINKALLKTLKGGTKTYLALTLQPYGALYLAADYAYQKLGQVVLQPVEFEVGQTTWLDSMPDYLHKVAEMLLNKPQLNMKLCGFYTAQDQNHWQQKGLKDEALTQKLREMANIRQNSVKAWLIEHENIDVERLSTCQPDLEPLAETGVLLSL